MVSMLFTLLVVPWLSSKKARTLKKHAANEQGSFLNHFYDYKAEIMNYVDLIKLIIIEII